MSGVEVTITGILYDRQNRTSQNVTLIGEAILTNVGVGGGPVVPPGGGGGEGIWPSPGHPAHPIAPGGRPPGIWGPTDPRPGWGLPGEPPGVGGGPIPPKPEEPPPEGGDKPPPDDGGWGYVSEWSKWGYFPAEDQAQPKAPAPAPTQQAGAPTPPQQPRGFRR